MTVIHIRAADTTAALDEVARRFGKDALILSTTQKAGGVEVAVAQEDASARIKRGARKAMPPPALGPLPPRLVLLGPPGAGVSMLAGRLAAQALQRQDSGVPQLVALRADPLAPPSPLVAHARLIGLPVDQPHWPDGPAPCLEQPAPAAPQIVDLSGLGASAPVLAKPLLGLAGARCWLVLPTGLHVQAQDMVVPRFASLAHAIALTRADICPLTLEDRALPQRFGLPLALVTQGTGLLAPLGAPEPAIAVAATPDQ